MDNPESPLPAGHAETPGQKQARLRRERREAKIKAGGSARLEKITNVSGRQNLPEPPPTAAPSSQPDPDEIDLSTHPSAAGAPVDINHGGQFTEADLRTLLRSGSPQPGSNDSQQQQGDEDPMMKLLQQMMGGRAPGADAQSGEDTTGLPPGLAAIFGAGGTAKTPGMGGPQAQEDGYSYMWKIVHAMFALALGIYVMAKSHAFNGDVTRGGITGAGHEGGVNVFWAFATAELVLQSSRFFLERGKTSPSAGWVGIVGGMLREPYRTWLMLASRYSRIWSTVVEDGMVVVFVVGLVAWWRGAVG